MRRNHQLSHLPANYRSSFEDSFSSKGFDIEDAEPSARNHDDVQSSGKIVLWESLEEKLERLERYEKSKEHSEKRKWRCRITIAVVSVWLVWIFVGLARLVLAGDSLLLTSSAAMSVPFVMIVRFYFMRE
jgi:hypothetical protein